MKHALTQTIVTVRKPYNRHDTDKPVPCSFLGTANTNSPFLDKADENTRYVVIELLDIHFEYSEKIDKDQLWAQMYAEYLDGESWKLEAGEREIRSEVNEEYRIENPYVGLVLDRFEIMENYQYSKENYSPSRPQCWPTVKILEIIGVTNPNPGNTRDMSEALQLLGLTQSSPRKLPGHTKKQRYWDGIRIKAERLAY